MAVHLSFWQKLQSVFYPVSVRKGSTALNPVLELFYFRGRYILATNDAVYSDGNKYRPLLKAFNAPELRSDIKSIERVLVLGTGLASAVHILAAKDFYPQFTLIEIDALVLEWAKEFLPQGSKRKVEAVNADAMDFVAKDKNLYNLIIVDIFFGRKVPEAITQSGFLANCRARLSQGGFLILNYMEAEHEKSGAAGAKLKQTFNAVTELSFGINKVYIAR